MPKAGTLSDIFDQAQQQETIVTGESTVEGEVVKEEIKEVVEAIVEKKEEVSETKAEAEKDDSVATEFNFGDEESNTEDGKPVEEKASPINWKEAIKAVDKKELFAELGIPEMDDFVIELAKYRANGGDTAKYLEARAIDYTKVSDADLLKTDFYKKYNHLDAADRDYLFNKKYGVGEFDDEDVQREKSIAIRADAHEVRQRLIAEQQSFKITDVAQNQNDAAQQQQALIEQQELQRQAEETTRRFMEHDVTQKLMTSKRVAVNLGDDVPAFNFPVNNPNALLKVILDADTWHKATTNDKGEPDVAKMQKLALVAVNPNYDRDLVNYGRTLERKEILLKDQNAKKPTGSSPTINLNKETKVVGAGRIGDRR